MSGTLKIAGTTLATNPTNSKVEIDDAVSGKGLAKAWVNFDGSAAGTNNTFTLGDGIRDAFNVSSVTDEGSPGGTYTINFPANLLIDANYSFSVTSNMGDNIVFDNFTYSGTDPTATTLKIRIYDSASNVANAMFISVIIFGS